MPEWLIPTILRASPILAMWLGKRTSRVGTRLGDRIGRVEKRLMDAFYQVFGTLDIGPLSRRRLLRLTELGQAVSVEIRAGKSGARVAGSLSEWVRKTDACEIQERCFEFAEEFDCTSAERRPIRESADRTGPPCSGYRTQGRASEHSGERTARVNLSLPPETVRYRRSGPGTSAAVPPSP